LKDFGFREFFENYILAWWKDLIFHNSSFALRYFLMVYGKAIVWHIPYSILASFIEWFVSKDLNFSLKLCEVSLSHKEAKKVNKHALAKIFIIFGMS
jgi:hypothetical protein